MLWDGSVYDCVSCGKAYPSANGVLSLGAQSGTHGELSKEDMQEFLRAAEEKGWQWSLENIVMPKNPAVAGLILDDRRSRFLDLLQLPKNGVALDIGCGYGGISLQLARRCAQVFALDNGLERLGFLATIARQEGIPNVCAIHHEDITSLPFADGSLDLIVLVGVFEYLPLAYPEQSIEQVQRRVLAELYRALRIGGHLYIGTKNRFGWWYWKGAADHNRLRFGPILPRRLANRLTQRLYNRPYRIVVDSLPAYRRLLQDAGFENPAFYWPISGYQFPDHFVSLGDAGRQTRALHPGALRGWKKGVTSSLRRLGVLKYVVPHFSIVAQKN
jgi:SAM-dependent methyltransferase